MVREAKKIVSDNKIGQIEYINVEYIQDWSNGKKVTNSNAKSFPVET